jgi:hypothetical protein
MFSFGEQMKPTGILQSEIGSDFTAISLQRKDQQALPFPLSLKKLQKPEKICDIKLIKTNLVEVAKIV